MAYALQRRGEMVITPTDQPDPADDKSWTFPDTAEGIRAAIDRGADTFWANTVLHSQHALVTMQEELSKKGIKMVGQSPILTEKWDDKANTNLFLAQQEGLTEAFPKSRILYKNDNGDLDLDNDGLGWPRVMKPIRGRGSHGVAVVHDEPAFRTHLETLFGESDAVLVEVRRRNWSNVTIHRDQRADSHRQEFCSGEEITVTILPPGEYSGVGTKPHHWALPVVQRVGHKDGQSSSPRSTKTLR